MKKIAILTITNSGLNFGNRLQNYALQHVLETLSVEAETIYSSKSISKSIFLSRIRRLFKSIFKVSGRRKSFNAFERKYIKKAKRHRYERLNDHCFKDEYDGFIAGSDQIWNPSFPFNSDFEFMVFADPSKRYSYSASFGIDEIPEENKSDYVAWLQQIKRISVRENQGRNIVEALIGRNADVHIDPTMLLTAEHYKSIACRPNQTIPVKYLLMYFLGDKLGEYVDYIKRIAKLLNIVILEMDEYENTPLYHIGPQHFLYLIQHARYVCTDSFHGTTFAILFQKPFSVFYRSDTNMPMHSRIDTLLEKMGLQDRLYSATSVKNVLNPIPYEKVMKRLDKERDAAINYLREIVDQC